MPATEYTFKSFKYSSHYWILKALERESSPVNILDVGCAAGYLGKVLSERGHHVTGVEADAATAEKARPYYDSLLVANAETFSFPHKQEFDYIFFADVLEHLCDPISVLRTCLPALKESGKIVISVPNIANLVIRLSLLFGNFNYADRGILDRTHLRFFTLRTLKEMVREVPCRILDVTPTPLPVQLVFPLTQSALFTPLHAMHYAVTRLWKTGLGYQFVVTATPLRAHAVPEASKQLTREGALASR